MNLQTDMETTQAKFGELVGISQPAVSDLVRAGVLSPGQTAGQWLLAYCSRLREQAAGRLAEGGLDLATERARLAREQADRVAMVNAQTRRELAPVATLEQALADVCKQIADVLEAIPVNLKRRGLADGDALELIRREIASVRNLAAETKLTWDDDVQSGNTESDPEGA